MAESIIKREDVKAEDTWAMEDIFESDDLWEKEAAQLKEMITHFPDYQGNMCESAAHLLEALQKQDALNKCAERVYVYANQKYHENTGNGTYQKMSANAQMLLTQAGDALSFVEPELIGLSQQQWEAYKKQVQKLQVYDRYMQELFRAKDHILSKEMEAVLARVYDIAQGPQNTFSMFNNADVKFGMIKDEAGEETQLTHGRYVRFLESRDRNVRRAAFETLYKKYDAYQNTLASLMYTNVQQAVFYARERHYASSLEAALDGSHIPTAVYDNLIKAVHSHMQPMYDYMDLRRKMLGVDELHMYDLHVPMVDSADLHISFEQAKEMVLEGLSVLGEDYLEKLREGFDHRWIDVYENEGKRSGAYSWGAYGTHPYVLLNYTDNLNNVFTLAHEMGHALHSYYSDAAQPYPYAGYKIFVAEVASTCNESLLIHYLIQHAKDKAEKSYLINYFLDQFKGTLYRQTMFAEFEKTIHHMVEAGESLTAEHLNEIYYGLNQQYYGEQVVSDPQIALEWSRIPHFYNPFYVYQYATGFSAAIAISQKILDGEEGIVEKYKRFLSGGSSMDCIDLLKICGVDMSTTRPVEEALNVFAEHVKMLEELTEA